MGFNENEPNVAQRCAAAGICQSQQATRHCCVHAHNRFSCTEVWSEIACVHTTQQNTPTHTAPAESEEGGRGRAGVTWGVMTSTVGILLYCVLSDRTTHTTGTGPAPVPVPGPAPVPQRYRHRSRRYGGGPGPAPAPGPGAGRYTHTPQLTVLAINFAIFCAWKLILLTLHIDLQAACGGPAQRWM